jgi:CubicO group peptidase (beta-lactamase class C family)
MTKPITGCAIMMLIEDGKLTLDTPLSDIFPGYAQMKVLIDPANSLAAKPATKRIKIRHLVTHSAGLAYAWNTTAPLGEFYAALGLETTRGTLEEEARRPKTLIGFAERMAFVPLLFEPGTSWHYSLGLDVAAAVVEKVSGAPFEDFLTQRIFTPLGMTDTVYTVPADKLPRLTTKYEFTSNGLKVVETGMKSDFARKPRFPGGGGGLVSSARDYSKFLAMLLGEGQLGRVRVLKTETARVMMSNLMEPGVIATPTVGTRGYGAGGRSVTIATPGGEAIGTYGWTGAFNTQAFVDRASGVYAVLMTQIANWPVNSITAALSKAVYADLAH